MTERGLYGMWDDGISVGCLTMVLLWAATFALIGVGWRLGIVGLMAVGLACSALAAALTIMRDNQRTRRMLARPGEVLRPLRKSDLP